MSEVNVLFFTADPYSAPAEGGAPRLLLDAELRDIRERVRAAEHGDRLRFDVRPAVRTQDLQQALNEVRPQVVHFSGHGGEAGLVVVGPDGSRPHFVPPAAIIEFFQIFRGEIRVVVLNACFSLEQAQQVADVVGCAIGSRGPITDEAAITFGAAFYGAIGFGHSVRVAYEQACNALALDGFEQWEHPQLVTGVGVDAAQVNLVAEARARAARGLLIRLAGMTALVLSVAGVSAAVAHPGDPPVLTPDPSCPVVARSPASIKTGAPSGASSPLATAKGLERAGDYAGAFPIFKQLADAGNAEAMGFVGVAYLCGQGIDRQPELGIWWLRQGASKRDARSMNALGAAYQSGYGVRPSVRWALHWYRIAADSGDAEGMRNLGSLYREGRKYDSALVWYRKAVNAHSPEAMVDVGLMHEEGLGVPPGPEQAFELYQKAAQTGSLRGMLAIGRSYQDAVGVRRDYIKAREWYLRAVDAGSADAMNSMGVLYQNGWAAPRDLAQAIRWYRRARDAGSPIAAANLADAGAR
jgi:TPR repeat protein